MFLVYTIFARFDQFSLVNQVINKRLNIQSNWSCKNHNWREDTFCGNFCLLKVIKELRLNKVPSIPKSRRMKAVMQGWPFCACGNNEQLLFLYCLCRHFTYSYFIDFKQGNEYNLSLWHERISTDLSTFCARMQTNQCGIVVASLQCCGTDAGEITKEQTISSSQGRPGFSMKIIWSHLGKT